jgi:hypothetical protein
MRTSKHLLIVSLLALAASQVALASDATGSFTRTLKVTGTVDLDVSTGAGNITLKSGDNSDVYISAKIRANNNNNWFGSGGGLSAEEKVKRIEANPPIEQNGNTISIGHIEDRDLRQNVSISYEITVPTETKARTQTGSGDQVIQDIRGPLRAQTGSGNIRVTKIGDETRVSTGSGDVRIESIKGRVYASTGSGTVHARGISGGFSAETGSGDVTLEQEAPGDVVAKTGSGSVRLQNVRGGVEARTGSGEVEVNGEPTGNWEIHTGSGSINLRLPSQAGFDLDARSSSGSVTVNRPVTVQGTLKRNRVQGKVGAGGVLLSLETGSGDIRLD